MKILFIAPLPPPLGGHSLAAQVLYDDLKLTHEVAVVNFNKNSFKEGIDSIKRILEVIQILIEVWKKKKNADVVYLTISESFAGNIKDLFIYLICSAILSKIYIHLHGGSIRKLLWDRKPMLFNINKMFIKKFAGVIIEGESHNYIFSDIVNQNKIHIVPNFAQNYLFVTEEEIRIKFSNINPLRILFVSNMIEQKGYNDLVDAFFILSDEAKEKVRIHFAGRFEGDVQQRNFLTKISGIKQMQYHGIVEGFEKKELFSQAHVFCFPSYFLEGQGIVILEAYAAGCAVMTTGLAGISDIFSNEVNGYKIKPKSADSIKQVIEQLISSPDQLLSIGLANRKIAYDKYTTTIYNNSLKSILETPIYMK